MSDYNNSLSISVLSNYDEATNILTNIDKSNIKNYPIRCCQCSRIATLKADFKNDSFTTICDNQHRNEYNSFSSFMLEANKDLSKVLCNDCQKSNDEEKLFKCNNCNLFFCDECKNSHKEKNDYPNFVEINKIDNYCAIHDEKYKYFNNKEKRHICQICYNNLINKKNIIEIEKIAENQEEISKQYAKVSENITICKNIQKILYDWLEEITKKVHNYCESLNNYYFIQNSVLFFLKNDNNREIYNNNFNALMNYEAFNKNKNNIDIYIQQINNKINNFYSRNSDLEKMSNNFIQLLNDFNEIKFVVDSEKVKEESIEDNKKSLDEHENQDKFYEEERKKKKFQKIEKMQRKKIEMDSEIKCFSPLNDEKMIILGLKSGKIQIIEFGKEIKLKNTIEEFENEIKIICELDSNLFAATDGKNKIKIIELEKNSKNYKLIQEIDLMEDSSNIYTMINLPNISYNKKRHYFCTGDANHIKIWKSNKKPKERKIYQSNNHEEVDNYEDLIQEEEIIEDLNNDEPLKFTLVKDIELNTTIRCLKEVKDKYIAAACTSKKAIKFFDVYNDFEEVANIGKIPASCGSNTLALLPNNNHLIVACTDGFRVISTSKFDIIKNIHCKYIVTSLAEVAKNCIICCGSNKNENKIRQYKIDRNSSDFSKYSEKNLNDNEIWNFKVINNRVFYSIKNLFYFLE